MLLDSESPKFVPKWLRPAMTNYLKETKRNKWVYGILAAAFLFLLCQFVLDSFAPGKYLLVRQLVFIPMAVVGSLCILKVVRQGFLNAGVIPFLFVFVGMSLVRALRTEGLDKVFAVLLVEPIFYSAIWYWSRSRSSKSSL
jgi:hypothetical protein